MNTATTQDVAASTEPYIADNPSHSRLALKHDAHFLVLNDEGQLPGNKRAGYGFYYNDTRYLNQWQLTLNGSPLRLLRSSVSEGFAGKFVYGNPSLPGLPEQTVLVEQDLVIVDGRLQARIAAINFGIAPVNVRLDLHLNADFWDIFEVRGATRPRRGTYSAPMIGDDERSMLYAYRGLDDIEMRTRVRFGDTRPTSWSAAKASFEFALGCGHREKAIIDVTVSTEIDNEKSLEHPSVSFADSHLSAKSMYAQWRERGASITTQNDVFNRLLERGYRDIYILRQRTPRGYCLAAGIPWFTVAFGRDQCITGMQMVALLPELTREIVEMLAGYQGTIDEEFTVQQIGKIMHELRLGEMARLREIPFIPYYGTVDATQLWLMLLCRYVDWTGDLAFARRMWKHVKSALGYLERATTDGYIQYGGKATAALTNQGWKDSHDSIMYSDGKQAKGPIALCEAQGYLYAAWSGLSNVAVALGYTRQARSLARKATALQSRFTKDFWMPEKNFVALALDGDGRQCDVVSSNPGHLLGTGILSADQAFAVADRLMAPDLFCGWGIRTLSSDAAAYNPMSYHNGSVWPHDNAEAVYGFGRIGRMHSVHEVMRGMFDVAKSEDGLRLPELFSGFNREQFEQHVSYPVSCTPQAWAAGSMFHMLASCLGLHPNAVTDELRIVNPSIPEWLGTVTVRGLRIGKSRVDLRFAIDEDGGTTCRVLSKTGTVRVIIEG